MTRSLLPFAVAFALLGLGSTPQEADAGVKGKSYNVDVTKNRTRDFDDFYDFQSDGRFVARRGGVGTWSQVNLLVASVWYADFHAGTIHVNFVGLQFGSRITGFGSNSQGDIFQSNGTEGPYDGHLEESESNLYIVD